MSFVLSLALDFAGQTLTAFVLQCSHRLDGSAKLKIKKVLESFKDQL